MRLLVRRVDVQGSGGGIGRGLHAMPSSGSAAMR